MADPYLFEAYVNVSVNFEVLQDVLYRGCQKAHLAKIENWQTHCMSIYWSKNDPKFIFRL